MSTNNADRPGTASSREQMPPPPPRTPRESVMVSANSKEGDCGTGSAGEPQKIEETSFDSLSTADTDTILAHWRKQRHNNNSIAVASNIDEREGKVSIMSAFGGLNVTAEEDDLLNYSDSFSVVPSNNSSQKLPVGRNSLTAKGADRKNQDDAYSVNTSPIMNGHGRRSTHPQHFNGEIGGEHAIIPEGDISLLQSYNSVDEHISLQDFNSVANGHESPYKYARPQNPQHTHLNFDTDLSIISHSSESMSSAFLAGLRAVGDGVPNGTHKPLVTPTVMDSNGVRRGAAVGFFNQTSPNGLSNNIKSSNGAVEERDQDIHNLELEVLQWKKGHADLDSVKQQQNDLMMKIEKLKQNIEDYTCRYNSLCHDIETRENELSTLKADVQFTQTEKEEMRTEYEELHQQMNQLSEKLEEKRSALAALEREKSEAYNAVEKAKSDLVRITKETEVTVSNCKARESEVTKLVNHADEVSKNLRAEENRLQTEQKKLEAERIALGKETNKLSQKQIESSRKFLDLEHQLQSKTRSLAEEKKQISSVQNELLRVQSAQSEAAAKLRKDEEALEEYSYTLNKQIETLLNREKACTELEALVESRMENLSVKEKACAKHEGNLTSQAKDLADRENTCLKRELDLEESLKKISQLEMELSKKVEDIASRDTALSDREQICNSREQDVKNAADEIERRKQCCNEQENKLQEMDAQLSSREQDVSNRENVLAKRETECTELENELVEAGEALSQGEQICAQKLDDAHTRIEKFIEREQVVCRQEEEAKVKSKELSEREKSVSDERKSVDLLAKSIADREAYCSEQEGRLTERAQVLEDDEMSIQRKQEDLQAQWDAFKHEKQTISKMKQDLELEIQQNHTTVEQQNRRLGELAESQNSRKHQLDSQEKALIAAKAEMDKLMSKMEAEQTCIVHKENTLEEAMAYLKEQTESLNDREKALVSREKELSDTQALIQKNEDDLQSKSNEVLAEKAILAKAIESAKETADSLDQKEATLTSLEKSLKTKEKEIIERENLVQRSAVLNSKIQLEEQLYKDLQYKCEDASNRLQALQDEAANLRPVLSDAVTRFEKESKELEDITRRKQMLSHEVSILTEKARNSSTEEEQSRNAVLALEKQYQDLLIKMQHEKDQFDKSLERRSHEFIASQQRCKQQLETKTRLAMNQLCKSQAAAFEGASHELSYRHAQIELIVSNISKFRVHLASWAEEKHKLAQQLSDSIEEQRKCMSLLEKTEAELAHSQSHYARLQSSIEKQNTLNIELEHDRSNLRLRLSKLEKKASDLEAAKFSCQQELEQLKISKDHQMEQKAQKLKELMQSITIQNERLHKKQKTLEARESTLELRDRHVLEEATKNGDLYQLVQQQNAALKSLEQDLGDRLIRQETKERELSETEEILANLEAELKQKQEEISVGKRKLKDLALQLQKRNEEMNVQKQQLQERIRHCDEHETRLSAWEQRLDEMVKMLEGQEEDVSTP